MDEASAQTEKIASYETSRTRRSIVDGNVHSDDSNNDEEYATSGFYVREKATEKKPDSASSSASKDTNKECKENGVSSPANSPVENGDESDDRENSRDSKKEDRTEDLNNQSKEGDQKKDVEAENDERSNSPTEQGDKKQESEEKPGDEKENSKESVDDDKDSGKNENSNHAEEEVGADDKIVKYNESNDKIKEGAKEETKEIEEESPEKETKSEEKNDTVESENKEKNEQANKEINVETEDKPKESETESDPSIKNVEGSDDKDEKKDEPKKKSASEENISILKDQLEKTANGSNEETMETEMEMDEDFDPSLLCPDISMDVDEAPVITNNEPVPDDGSTSPLPYEATFSTLVDEITGAEVQVDLTPEEMELRSKMYGPNNLVQTTKVHCTACNIHLGSALTGANNRFVHPLLKVLICKNCYHFYTSGEFEKDEDGSELYCRWCGQGGQVLCCSSCEFVFCKRCIRNNFGPKKFKEIRNSDDWNCFRCDRGQLSNLRASCAEFMEYYRTELARAQALSQTNPELMSTDYTTCCRGGEKKDENKTPTQPKNVRKKRKDEEDPDYHPVIEEDGEPPKKKFNAAQPQTTGSPGYTIIPPTRPALPKPPVAGQVVRPVIMQHKIQNQGQVFKVGNTTFRARAPTSTQGYSVQRPTLGQGAKGGSPGYITIPPSAAPKPNTSPGYITIPPSAVPKTTPGYIKILPQRMQGPRPANSYTVVSGTNNGKTTFTTVRAKQSTPMPAMKHEWFEKTVRAAARVNSNLSYTLTQLNRQQSQANSVEALAMVHNKLQEVLSTSINSLIQIRKNLRTEFISGIKNIKFPAKPASISPSTAPIVVKDDDDVIFVNSPPKTASTLPPPPPLVLSPSVSLTRKTPIQNTTDPFADPKPSTSGISLKPSMPTKGGFLKVRSFTALQSVTSECITIPDDPPTSSDVKIVEEEDPLKISDDDKSRDDKEASKSPVVMKGSSTFDEFMVYNVKQKPTAAIKKMLGATVIVKRSRVVDEIMRAQGLLVVQGEKNDESSEKDTERKEDKDKKEATEKKKKGKNKVNKVDKKNEDGKDKDTKEDTNKETESEVEVKEKKQDDKDTVDEGEKEVEEVKQEGKDTVDDREKEGNGDQSAKSEKDS